MYISRTEAYTHALVYLNSCISKYIDRHEHEQAIGIEQGIRAFKQALLNHEQDAGALSLKLLGLASFLEQEDALKLRQIAQTMQLSAYVSPPLEKWQNELGRRLESEIATTLLKSPTGVMLDVVKRVSAAILKVIEANQAGLEPDSGLDEEETRKIRMTFDSFLHSLTDAEDFISLGAYAKKPTLKMVIDKLEELDIQYLWQIMHIHYKFAQVAFRRLPVAPTSSGRGSPTQQRIDAANVNFYETPMFTVCPNRGRKGPFKARDNSVDRLGIMLQDQDWAGLGRVGGTKWVPDCLAQAAELDPAEPGYTVVRDMINNDVPYVAGFSGMCSLLMPQMMVLCDNSYEDEQRAYLCAVIAYIVGGGFHNLHEVIAPSAFILMLIPEYLAVIPDPDVLAPAPNYQLFFDLISTFDAEFQNRLDIAMANYIKFAEKRLHAHLEGQDFYAKLFHTIIIKAIVARLEFLAVTDGFNIISSIRTIDTSYERRVLRQLKEKLPKADLPSQLALLREYFNQHGRYNLLSHSFCGQLLQNLKTSPLLITMLNLCNVNRQPAQDLKLDTKISYTFPPFQALRAQAISWFQSVHCQELIPERFEANLRQVPKP